MKQQSEPTAFETNLAVRLSSPNKLTKIVGSPGSDGHNVAPSSSSSLVVKYKSSFLQVLAAFVALLGAWAIGCILCYTSPAIPSMKRMYPIETLQSHSSNQTSSSVADATSAAFLSPEDHESETWITSIINLGALAGSIIGGPLNCRFGHRRFLFVVGVGCAVGWLVIAFANHVWLVLLGRAITGFCGGLICVSVPVYIVDIATIGSRGFLGCSFQGMITLGILFTSTCGAWMEWRFLAFLCALPTLLMAVLIVLMPESPQWLLRQGRTNEARQSLSSLRARHSDITGELQLLMEHQQSVSCDSAAVPASSSFLRDLKYPVVWKPLVLGVLLMSFQQLSGANGLIGCLESVIRQTGDSLDARVAAILVNSALVLSAWVAAVLVNMLGRKTLLLISAGGYLLAYTMLSAYYALDSRPAAMHQLLQILNLDPQTFVWTPVIALFIFFLLHAIGYGGVPWFLVPELCVNGHRAQIAAVCSTINWTLSFLVMKNFTPMLTHLGSTCTFAIFAVLAALSGLYVIILVPETKGKSAAQIRHIFQKHS